MKILCKSKYVATYIVYCSLLDVKFSITVRCWTSMVNLNRFRSFGNSDHAKPFHKRPARPTHLTSTHVQHHFHTRPKPRVQNHIHRCPTSYHPNFNLSADTKTNGRFSSVKSVKLDFSQPRKVSFIIYALSIACLSISISSSFKPSLPFPSVKQKISFLSPLTIHYLSKVFPPYLDINVHSATLSRFEI